MIRGEDVISREAVLNLIEHYNSDGLGSVFYNYYQGKKFADEINKLPSVTLHEKKFEKIVVEYPPADLCTYPEYRGKPYFSIKYEENGEHFIGFGTYNPEVLSRYLQEYFITPAVTESEETIDADNN